MLNLKLNMVTFSSFCPKRSRKLEMTNQPTIQPFLKLKKEKERTDILINKYLNSTVAIVGDRGF